MKLFDDFEMVKFSEENLLFVTKNRYIYYIYNVECKIWKKYKEAGNDRITIDNYQEVQTEEIIDAMKGIFPKKETDFLRLCNLNDLSTSNFFDLINEDYSEYMSDEEISYTVYCLFEDSAICHKSFLKMKSLFNDARACSKNNEELLLKIKNLCFEVIGRDIFKHEIGIIDGHDNSSYFWIMAVRVIDYENTDAIDAVAEMKSVEISIEEDDVYNYLFPFLKKYFDNELEANKKRVTDYWIDNDGTEQFSYVSGFEWYLTHNFYSFDSITNMLKDINDTIEALSCGKNNEFTEKLRKTNTKAELIIDFYQRFIYRIEYMMKVGKEKGYDLISFMGP